jgi:hypothetical protein
LTFEIHSSFLPELTVRLPGSQYSLADKVTRLWGGYVRESGLIPCNRYSSLIWSFHTDIVAHTASYSIGVSLGIKRSRCEADHSLHLLQKSGISRATCPLPHSRHTHRWYILASTHYLEEDKGLQFNNICTQVFQLNILPQQLFKVFTTCVT